MFARVLGTVSALLLVGGGLGLGLGLLGVFAWWLDLFAHFRLQYAGMFGLSLVLAGLARRGSLAATAALLLVAELALLAPYAISEERASVGAPLRLAHLNVLTSNRQHAEVAAWIAGTGADVVLLQEVWSARRRPLLRPLYPHVAEAEAYWRNPMNWIAGPVEWARGRYLTIDSGLMTLSKHPVREVRRYRYRAGRSPAKR